MKTKIKRWGINGEGIAYLGRKPFFVENAIPGEIVEAEITEDTGKYAVGKAVKILEKSPRRRDPLCLHQQECGGCQLMHVDYKGQIRMKEHAIAQALHKYAGYDGPIEPVIKNPDPLGYRNACKLPFGKNENGIFTGLYRKDSNQLIETGRCIIHSRKLEKARQAVTEVLMDSGLPVMSTDGHGLCTLVLKEFDGQTHAVLVTTDMQIPDELAARLMEIENMTSLWQNIRTEKTPEYELFGPRMLHLAGAMKMTLQLQDITLNLLPKSFFQLNTKQAEKLYQTIADWVPQNTELLVEAYSGVGAISMFAHEKAQKILGVEYVEDAVANANENALLNGVENTRFYCGDAGEFLKKTARKTDVDVLIADPPRSGLNAEMKQAVFDAHIKTMIYVSCNPSTLGKDLAFLQKEYEIKKVQPFDFFSQTPHVETVVLMSRKDKIER